MKRRIDVVLGAEAVSLGELRYDRQGRRESAAFMYTSDWLGNNECFAIDPTLPLVSGYQFHARRADSPLRSERRRYTRSLYLGGNFAWR